MELLLRCLFIGTLTITSYRPVKSQTDDSPFYTSTGEKVRAGGCAISRDLLCGACRKLHHRCKHPEYGKKLHYGEWLYVEKYGYRQVNDVMGNVVHYRVKTKHGNRVLYRPIRHAIDLFVEKWAEEHSVGVRQLNVYKVEEPK